ncbi:MAG: hypothetical protein ACYTGV_03270 [Planctomycetota bacterium]
MSRLPETISLTPEEEAERLWKGSQDAFAAAADDFIFLCSALDLGVRAVETMAIQRLQPARASFPATIGSQLETPDPEVQPARDALAVPRTLQFIQILDLLSEDELECVSPRLHTGWEDKHYSCLRSRSLARETIGLSLGAEARAGLLLLAAYRNRIFRTPPPIRIVTKDLLDAFPALVDLYGKLSAA